MSKKSNLQKTSHTSAVPGREISIVPSSTSSSTASSISSMGKLSIAPIPSIPSNPTIPPNTTSTLLSESNSNRIKTFLNILSVSERASLLFTLGSLLFFLISSALLLNFLEVSRQAIERAKIARDMIDAVEGIRLALMNAETGSRGYLLSEREDFLTPIQGQLDTSVRFMKEIKRLTEQLGQTMTSDEQRRSDTVAELEQVSHKEFDFVAKILLLDAAHQRDEAIALIKEGQDKVIMDRARELIEILLKEQRQILEDARALRERANDATSVVSTVSLLLAMGLLIIAAAMAGHLIRKKRVIAEQEARAKAVERALEISDRQFKTLTSALSQIVWTANPAGEVIFQNRPIGSGAKDFSEIPNTDNLGVKGSWMDLLHPHDKERVTKAWSKAVASQTPFDDEFRLRGSDTQPYIWYLGRATPMMERSSNVVLPPLLQWFGTLTDIDSQRKLLDERDQLLASERAARSNAELAGRLKDEFVATLSHELRTPLNAMLGWIQICQRRKNDRKTWETALDVLDRNARLQSKLISDLLDSRRLIAGKVDFQNVTVDVGTLVTKLVADFEPTAKAKIISLSANCSIPTELVVVGDEQRLYQVFSNLVSNAIKFTPRSGKVTITCGLAEDGVQVKVTDSGIGMSEEFLEVAFDRYRQANASSSRSFGGLGLGLAIAKSIVDAHGGSIVAESAGPDSGSTFTVTLPVFDASLATESRQLSPTEERLLPISEITIPSRSTRSNDRRGAELAGVRLLVIDDQVDARLLVRELLVDYGMVIELAAGGLEGLKAARAHLPQIVLCDIGMPEMDGYTVARHMRADPDLKNITMIALTAHTRPEDIKLAMNAGFNQHIGKPLDAEQLLSTLCACAASLGRPRESLVQDAQGKDFPVM